MREQIKAVQKMQDYIEKHLDENITLADLAKVSMFSPWHSYRLFIKLTKRHYSSATVIAKSSM